MKDKSPYKNIAFVASIIVLSQLVIYSWESWSSFTFMSSYNEAFDPSTTLEMVKKTEANTPVLPETKDVLIMLDTASKDLKMLHDVLLVNVEGAELRLERLFYVICALSLCLIGVVSYVLYLHKKF